MNIKITILSFFVAGLLTFGTACAGTMSNTFKQSAAAGAGWTIGREGAEEALPVLGKTLRAAGKALKKAVEAVTS